ncbi:MAG: Mov34/MPN/PAD-1 family protein [Promethearchaeota archaeon]
MTIEEDFVFPVYIHHKVLSKIKKTCKNFKREIFGYLVGEIFIWKEQKYSVIKDQIFIKAGTESHKFFTTHSGLTTGLFDDEFKELKRERKNDNLWIVGWWHSHPGFGCFLSSEDIATQQTFFPDTYQVALVIDPIKDEFNFFNLDNSKSGYKPISFAIIS